MYTICNTYITNVFLLLIIDTIHFINIEIKENIFKLINNCSDLSVRLSREEINILL